jgi:hypothetical protein
MPPNPEWRLRPTPLVFCKFLNCITGPTSDIIVFGPTTDWEAELSGARTCKARSPNSHRKVTFRSRSRPVTFEASTSREATTPSREPGGEQHRLRHFSFRDRQLDRQEHRAGERQRRSERPQRELRQQLLVGQPLPHQQRRGTGCIQ